MGKLIGRFTFLLNFLILGLIAGAQRVSDVMVIQDGQKLRIQYLLSTITPVDINLYVSDNNGATWQQISDFLNGSYGKAISSGRKEIIWDVLQSRESFVGNSFVFKIMVANLIESVKIGNQVWMVKNLNVDHYSNGDPISTGLSVSQWVLAKEGAYSYYNNDPSREAIYGKLYNWYAVIDDRGICPTGWHVPSDDEWNELIEFLGGNKFAGGKLKSTKDWAVRNRAVTNSIGFTALPGGCRCSTGSYNDFGVFGNMWTSTEYDVRGAWSRKFYSSNSRLDRNYGEKWYGFSVRCIKD